MKHGEHGMSVKSGHASGMVDEHREKEHHMVGQHKLGSEMHHGSHGVPGAGSVPATPKADSATEPKPSHPRESTMED